MAETPKLVQLTENIVESPLSTPDAPHLGYHKFKRTDTDEIVDAETVGLARLIRVVEGAKSKEEFQKEVDEWIEARRPFPHEQADAYTIPLSGHGMEQTEVQGNVHYFSVNYMKMKPVEPKHLVEELAEVPLE